jgi:acetyl esterase/lipase
VWQWLHCHGPTNGIATQKVVISGDSAGGNLGLALAIDQRKAGGPLPAGLALNYGCFAPAPDTESRKRYAHPRYGLTCEQMDRFWAYYLGTDNFQQVPPLAAPLYADLVGLPPVFLGVAECDIVADDSRLLAEKLRQASVAVELDLWAGGAHGMLQMTRDVELARDAMSSVARAVLRFVRCTEG